MLWVLVLVRVLATALALVQEPLQVALGRDPVGLWGPALSMLAWGAGLSSPGQRSRRCLAQAQAPCFG